MNIIYKKVGDNVLHISTSSTIHTYSIPYPIIWEGFLNSNKIKITHIDSVTFDFEGLEEKHSHLERDIIEEINKFLDEKLG